MGVFADLSGTSEPYADALCRRGVLAFGDPYLSRQWHDERGPCAWSLAVNGTEVAEFAAEFAAKRLAGGNADFAGGSIQGQPRVIATLAPNNPWYQESVELARARYEELSGQPSGPNYQYLLDLGQLSNQASELIPRMKADGVTTVICGCDPIFPVFLSGVAARENYFPEFIIAGTALTDADIVGPAVEPGVRQPRLRRQPAAGLRAADRRRSPTQAFKSVRPDAGAGVLRRPHLLPDVHAGDRHPDGRPEPHPRDLPARACTTTRRSPARSGCGTSAPATTPPPTTCARSTGIRNAVSSYNGQPGAYVGVNGSQRYLRDQLPSGPFPRPQ